MPLFRFLLALPALLIWTGAPALAQARSRLALHLDHSTVTPGMSVRAGVSIQLPRGWHTYWKNPGESGLAAKFRWELPPGVQVGEPRWPIPSRHVDGDADFSITTLILEGNPVIAFPVQIAGDASPGTHSLRVQVDWQECDTACIRGTTNLTARITIGDRPESHSEPILEQAWNAYPSTGIGSDTVSGRWLTRDTPLKRSIALEWNVPKGTLRTDFFPDGTRGLTLGLKPSEAEVSNGVGRVVLTAERDDAETPWPSGISGLLVALGADDRVLAARETGSVSMAEVGPPDSEPDVSIPPPETPPPFAWSTLLGMLGFAFIGGLILNIMPCVLPVLALKVLGFVRQAGNEPARVRRLAWIYGAGVMTSFAILAGLALAIQAGGGVASWGSAFQNPQFRIAMTILMVGVALNLFGVFEISLGGTTTSQADALTRREGAAGAFFHGLLAAVLATPCMAPFLATALAFAFTQPPLVVTLVFLTIGAGLATPFVLLCLRPAWLKMLPKPGLWMVRFKVAMGFPMLATAIWIFWFTAKRLGDAGVLWLGLALVILAAAGWVWGEFVQKGARPRWVAVGITLSLLATAYFGILEHQLDWRQKRQNRGDAIAWKAWNPSAVAEAVASGRPVLVDFTADNCVNCKLNKIRSIDIASTRKLLQENRFETLLGDFTDADPQIAAELKRFGRYGVPLVLVYSPKPGTPPTILPPLFGPAELHEALRAALP